ncbi:arginine deiminase family protein, partial [uncultured Demequina sp.]|uniref:arginine deiminase family protein n=1 Tax=uncultured Demequina sp. TaxID=693499 RepID=UPI002600515E
MDETLIDTVPSSFGAYSEVGRLRKVLVCSPGLAHNRLTPSNAEALLFDDVMWVENARRDHAEFVQLMEGRDIEVLAALPQRNRNVTPLVIIDRCLNHGFKVSSEIRFRGKLHIQAAGSNQIADISGFCEFAIMAESTHHRYTAPHTVNHHGPT